MGNISGLHCNEAVFAIPSVAPTGVLFEVAVEVVSGAHVGGGQIERAGFFHRGVAAAGAVDVDALIHGTGAVVGIELGAEVVALTVGGLAVDGDTRGAISLASDLQISGCADGVVLIERIGGVALLAQVVSGGVAAGVGAEAIADSIVAIFKLEAGLWAGVGEVALAFDHFGAVIIIVAPALVVGAGE